MGKILEYKILTNTDWIPFFLPFFTVRRVTRPLSVCHPVSHLSSESLFIRQVSGFRAHVPSCFILRSGLGSPDSPGEFPKPVPLQFDSRHKT